MAYLRYYESRRRVELALTNAAKETMPRAREYDPRVHSQRAVKECIAQLGESGSFAEIKELSDPTSAAFSVHKSVYLERARLFRNKYNDSEFPTILFEELPKAAKAYIDAAMKSTPDHWEMHATQAQADLLTSIARTDKARRYYRPKPHAEKASNYFIMMLLKRQDLVDIQALGDPRSKQSGAIRALCEERRPGLFPASFARELSKSAKECSDAFIKEFSS